MLPRTTQFKLDILMRVRIKQHADDGSLNDIQRFLGDVDRFFSVDEWHVSELEVSGTDCVELEEYCRSGRTMPDVEFRRRWGGIFQTIWGTYAILDSGNPVAEIRAVDSTYWSIESDEQAFVEHMVERYGEFDA